MYVHAQYVINFAMDQRVQWKRTCTMQRKMEGNEVLMKFKC